MNRRGFSLIEIVLASTILVIVAVVFAGIMQQPIVHFMQLRTLSQLNSDAQTSMTTMTHLLRQGKASSVNIQLVNSFPSAIDFDLLTPLPNANTHCQFSLVNGTIQMVTRTIPANPLTTTQQILASNATSLTFTGDPNDPGLVTVALQLDAPWDSSGKPERVVTVAPSSEKVRMISVQ